MTQAPVGDLPQFLIAFRRQLQFYLRTWRFIGLLLFTVIVSVAVLAIQAYLGSSNVTSGSSPASYLAGFLGNLSTTVILVAAFLGGDAITMDFGAPTGYFMLVQPVRRIVLLLGRFAAAVVAAAVVGFVYVAFAIGGTIGFFGTDGFPWDRLGVALGLLVLLLLGALAVSFFFSSLFKSPAISLVSTILLLWLGFSIVTGVLSLVHYEPWFSILYAGDGIPAAIRGTYAHASSVPAGPGLTVTVYTPYLWESAVISLGYLLVFLTLSIVLYNYRESKG